MNQLTNWSGYMPLLPEIVLAVGAMLMLMAGAVLGERSGRLVNLWCVLVLVAAAVAMH
jgi:NADH:ubiquinone oxidoreductase subunit 2 (subunit N)